MTRRPASTGPTPEPDAASERPTARLPARVRAAITGLGYQLELGGRERVEDTYHDTQGGALFRRGLRLRERHSHGLWQLLDAQGAVMAEQASEGDEPRQGALAARLAQVIGGARVLPHLEVRGSEEAFAMKRRGAGTVRLLRVRWRVAAPATGQWLSVPGGLSLVASGIDAPEVARVATVLRDLARVELIPPAPIVAGLRVLGLPLPGAPLPPELRIAADETLAQAALKVVRGQAYKMWANRQGTLEDADPEYLHDLRVATRRARQALRLFRDVLEGTRAQKLRGELTWIAGLLGEVRDLDVFLDRLHGDLTRSATPPELRTTVLSLLAARREPRLAELRQALSGARFEGLLAEMRGLESVESPETTAVARVLAGRLAKRQTRRLVRLVESATTPPVDEDLHRIRIGFKKLRYTLEFFTGVLGERVGAVVRRLVEFQDVLGAHQDAVIALARLDGMAAELVAAAEIDAPRAWLAVGALMQLQRDRAAEEKARFGSMRESLPKVLARLARALGRRGREPGISVRAEV